MSAVEPYEARRLPELPDVGEPDLAVAFNDLLTAVIGFPYTGESTNAIAYALRWLRANPDRADILLGRAA